MAADSSRSAKATRLILLAQGGEDPRWQKPYIHLLLRLKNELGEDRVCLAFLNQSEPSLMTTAKEAVSDGIEHLTILPVFLALGGAAEQDIPLQVVEIKERFPNLGVVILPPIGEHPDVTDAIYRIAKASCASSTGHLPSR
jgi:sirohydrochlorin cobaltochelatase